MAPAAPAPVISAQAIQNIVNDIHITFQGGPRSPDLGLGSGGEGVLFGIATLGDGFVAESGLSVTEEGIAAIEQHLAGLDALEGFAPNVAMIARLRAGLTESQDMRFYEHELIESQLMNGGLGARAAHLQTLEQQGIPYAPGYESQLYHPSVISEFLDHFNPAAHP